MYLKLILVFCVIPKEYGVIQNVASLPYKPDRDMQTYTRVNYDRYHENHKILNFFKESDVSRKSSRLFDWIKKILHKNDTNGTPKVPTEHEVLDDKANFRLIEKNLTETLTKLSHVLTQILNIVQYSRYQYLNDIHEILQTNIGKNKTPRRDIGRFKRGLDSGITPMDISRDTKPTEAKPDNKNYSKRDTKEEINMKMHINTINHDINVGNYDNKTKSNSNISTKNENAEEDIVKMDLNKSITALVKKGNDADSKRLENDTSKNIDTNNLKVLKNNALTKSDANNFNQTKTFINDSGIVTTNIDSHKNITKRDVTQIKLESIDVNSQDKSRTKRDTKGIAREVDPTSEKTEIMTNLEVKQENTSTKPEDSVNAGTINADFATKNSRRVLIQTKQSRVNDEIKNRLFKYIDEAFNEIIKKIDSLKHTKDIFSKDVSYKVGYIISNIDTLEVNMRNMRMDMNRNKYIWDDKKILNLYDTVKVSNQAVSDLLEILKMYVQESLNNN